MGEEQWKDPLLSLLYELVQKNSKPKLSQIRSKLIHKMLLQFDQFSLIEGVLHCRAILHGEEVQQLVLPHCFKNKVLKSIHDDSGHQGLERTLELVQSWVFWPNMFKDVDTYLLNCKRCQVLKGNYVGPKTQLEFLSAKQPLELFCIDFTKADLSKGGKENINSHGCFFEVQSSFCNQKYP